MFRTKPPSSDSFPSTTGNGRLTLRNPPLDNTTYILILLVVLIPVVFTVVLCTITYCIYRYNKKRTERTPTNSPIVPTDRSGISPTTVIYNTHHSPYLFEELPPSYDSLAEIKKDLRNTTNTNEQVQLTVLPNTTLTNINESTTTAAAVILPSAPTPPPPSYNTLAESNK